MEPRETMELLEAYLRENNLAQDESRVWTIECSPLGGRGMFATRDIRAGELIFTDVPLLIGPRYSKYLSMCVVCYKNNCPLFPCDHGCGLPICSTECENSMMHYQAECRLLREWMPTCGSTWSKDLMFAVVPIRGLMLSKEQRKLLYAFECHPNLTRNYENHCCVPNTRHHFDDHQRLYVSASLPIAAGEELTMSYTDLLWDTSSRRQFLRVTKRFSCNCSRCSDPSEFGSYLGALLCAKDDCSGYLLPRNPLNLKSPWICDKCQISMNHRQIECIYSMLNTFVLDAVYKTPREILKFIEAVLSKLIPTTNYIMIDVKYRIISYFGRVPNLKWEDLTDADLSIKKMYCNDVLSILDALGSGDSIKKGLVLYELYRTNLELSKRQISEKQTHSRIEDSDNKYLLRQAMNILQNDVSAACVRKSD
ncbi:SET domain-containing protein SmydA-8-like isoform X2 [Formica exsecta]|uniref:SET domain-containing protein SmydA-8-like isoform X2 n=1 Tax=Formica exsecta TaxID=72781 RepID=UPI001144B17E|nr:SET domain-containing protein SmydA-8-like isoform X2 [Formica exsecta]